MRTITPAQAVLFNQYGAGIVHMELFRGVEPPGAQAIPGAVRRLLMGVRQIARWVRGILSAPTQVASGAGTDFTAIDGLDVTAEIDDDLANIDFNVAASFSANPGSISFAIIVDNAAAMDQVIQASYAGTTVIQFSGSVSLNVGPGTHRYRLAATTANAVTITYTARDRSMRVSGLLGTA